MGLSLPTLNDGCEDLMSVCVCVCVCVCVYVCVYNTQELP